MARPMSFSRPRWIRAIDQLRTVDTERLVKRLGRLAPTPLRAALAVLQEMFAP
jgi:mRNA interferase MazF